MSIKSIAAKIYASWVHQKTQRWASAPHETQQRVFNSLIKAARTTEFGRDHDFGSINSHADFVSRVPVRDYEGLKPYVERIKEGASDVLWPGKPLYFAKTSGTTSGVKYIPITGPGMKAQVEASKNAILSYIHETGQAGFVDRKMIFLQGSPELTEVGGIKTGRLSGISAHFVPAYLQKNRLPSWKTNCIEDWESKVEAIVAETKEQDMGVIAGIPSWVQMYFERLQAQTGMSTKALFPHFQLFIYGGVNYEPYRAKFEALMGGRVDSIELFPASEGFFAYQDKQQERGMLLLLNSGIFYEFIEAASFHEPTAKRLTLDQVRIGVDYVLIISTQSGLWGYNMGDTVQFTSTTPYRVIVSGRIKHFISAFGEHVIAKEVEYAMQQALAQSDAQINEFTVAPQITPESGLPYHEWLIDFEKMPSDLEAFAQALDLAMRGQNTYYDDLIAGSVLRSLVITPLGHHCFSDYMRSLGRLGGQNKVQRLSNDRQMADALHSFNTLAK